MLVDVEVEEVEDVVVEEEEEEEAEEEEEDEEAAAVAGTLSVLCFFVWGSSW